MLEHLGRRPLKPWQGCVFATVVTAVTLGVRLALDTPLGGQPTLVIFTVPIMVSAYAGGLSAGLLATALSFFAASYYLLPPIHRFAVASRAERWQQFFVALAGVVISASNEALHRARRRAEIATGEHQHADLARQESEERYRAVVEWSPEALLVHRNATIVFVNPAAITMLGAASAADLLGRHVLDLMPADFDRTERERRPDTAVHEERLVKLDGTGIVVEVQSTPIVYDGAPSLLASLRDITDRKRVEAALRESEGRYRTLFEHAPDGILIADRESYYLDANASMCRMLGYSRDEFIGLHASDIVAPVEVPHIEPALRTIDASSDYHREWQFRRKDGSTFPADVIATTMPDGSLLGMVRDVSERQEAQSALHHAHRTLEQRVVERTAQLQTANHLLEAANEELASFSYSVSHDLRAPLRAISGFAGIVLEDYGQQLPGDGRKYLERIRHGGEQMGRLIDDLLAFSRLSRESMKRRMVDTGLLVRAVLEELNPQCEGRPIEITVGDLPLCYGDPALLKQVWANLLSNAIKYSRGRTPAVVEVGCRRDNGEDVFVVRDNGAGFEMAYAHKLFGVFQRLHRMDQFEGTGVGLAIVQRVVRRHGGRVWADAEVDRGATFHFTLAGENTA